MTPKDVVLAVIDENSCNYWNYNNSLLLNHAGVFHSVAHYPSEILNLLHALMGLYCG